MAAGRRRRRWKGTAALIGALAIAVGALGVVAPHIAGARTTANAVATKGTTIKPMIMYEGRLEMEMLPLSGKAPTWDDVSKVYAILSAARKATAKYRNITVAERDGYMTMPLLYVETQGYHYFNPRYDLEARLGHFDPTHPPVLVYNKVRGRMTLSGVMYIMPNSATPQQLAAIFPNSMASWHRHINICVVGFGLGGKIAATHDRATCTKEGGHFLAHPFGWMVHAWIWQNDGTGLFDMDRGNNTRATTLMALGM